MTVSRQFLVRICHIFLDKKNIRAQHCASPAAFGQNAKTLSTKSEQSCSQNTIEIDGIPTNQSSPTVRNINPIITIRNFLGTPWVAFRQMKI